MPREKAIQGHSKKVAVCKPRRVASGKTKAVDTLVLEFKLRELRGVNFCQVIQAVAFLGQIAWVKVSEFQVIEVHMLPLRKGARHPFFSVNCVW